MHTSHCFGKVSLPKDSSRSGRSGGGTGMVISLPNDLSEGKSVLQNIRDRIFRQIPTRDLVDPVQSGWIANFVCDSESSPS